MVVKKDIDAKMAEEMLLGSLLYKPDKIIHIIDEINPANFSVPTFGQIYNCILELYKDDVEPDDVMVINKAISLGYDIEPELVRKLANSRTLVTKKQIMQYAKIIKTSAFKRKTLILYENFLEKAKDMSSPENILSELSDLTLELSDRIKANNNLERINIDTKELTKGILDKMQNSNQINGLPFGFLTIDMATDGACPGEIITIAGMNGGCKTQFALTSMLNMARYLKENNINKYVVFFSLEMTKEQINNRLIAMQAGLNAKYLKQPRRYFIDNGIQPTKENIQRFLDIIANATKVINELPILVDDSSNLTAQYISLTVKKEHLKHGVACVFIDHAGKVMGDEHQEDWQIVAKSYLEWSRCAKDMRIPFVVLIQYLKKLKDEKMFKGTMQDLAGSKVPANESHKILHTWKPDIFPSVIKDHPEWINKVFILNDKNRDMELMQDVMLEFDNGRLRESIKVREDLEETVEEIFAEV